MAFVWAGIIQDNKNLVLSFEYGKQPFEIVNKKSGVDLLHQLHQNFKHANAVW